MGFVQSGYEDRGTDLLRLQPAHVAVDEQAGGLPRLYSLLKWRAVLYLLSIAASHSTAILQLPL